MQKTLCALITAISLVACPANPAALNIDSFISSAFAQTPFSQTQTRQSQSPQLSEGMQRFLKENPLLQEKQDIASLFQAYDHNKSYRNEYQILSEKIAQLPKYKYHKKHSLIDRLEWEEKDFSWKLFYPSNHEPVLVFTATENFGVSFNPEYGVHLTTLGIWVGTQEDTNQLYYLAVGLAEKFYQKIKARSQEWEQTPWKKPAQQHSPYNKKTDEFIFYGDEFCGPCHEVAFFLVQNKISFREKKATQDGIPYIYNEAGSIITGSKEIIESAKQIYNF